jgi:hypothetical protein
MFKIAASASVKLLKNHGVSKHMSSKSGTGRRIVKSAVSKKRGDSITAAPPAFKDPWVEVLDKASGQGKYSYITFRDKSFFIFSFFSP